MAKIKFDLRVRRTPGDPKQAAVVNAVSDTADWDGSYVEFSGYFGNLGPQLFAAAPDLLSALKAALPVVTALTERLDGPEASPLHRQIVAAIAKAEGKA